MALSIDSNTDSTPYLANGSLSTCDDIEEGGYSSQEEDFNEARDQLIVPKCIMLGGYTRRASQCESLKFRRHLKREEATAQSSTAVDKFQHQPLSSQMSKRECVDGSAPKIKIRTIMCGLILFLFTFSVTYFAQHSRVKSLHYQLEILHETRRHLEESHNKISQEIQSASFNLARYKETHEKMKQVNHDMSAHMRRLKEEKDKESLSEMEKRTEIAESRLQNIVDFIRSASNEQVIQKYGPGPHQVELLVKLPGSQATQPIKLELASVDTKFGMPHAILTFLDQVQAKAWDGAAFSFHAGHVLLAVPSPAPQGSHTLIKEAPTILFPEYNNAYPHEKYTVAFPGRPGTGQDFYINLRSNVINHSPRIQDGKFIEGEPCFARIIDEGSRYIVDQMDKMSVNSNGSLNEPVIIQEARIVAIPAR
eukprot:CCRYP_012957-RA/>CCRYP_012957-RA protein AED:0.40 eAED:0.41 QI:0/-1/0/1/-1/1/1/0/421